MNKARMNNVVDRFRVAWSALVNGRAIVDLNVTVVVKIYGCRSLCNEDFSAIREHVHMGVVDALDEYVDSVLLPGLRRGGED